MINIKTKEEIEIMQKGGKILSDALWEVVKNIKPGISELELDKIAQDFIIASGAEPGFKRVQGYKHTICVSTNDVVVHGIPTDYKLKEGDLIGIDCGVFYKGFHTDMSESVIVGDKEDKLKETFLSVGECALDDAIKQAKIGNHVGDISKTIQSTIEGNGYSVVRSLVGHGVGHELHEEPEVPGYLRGKVENSPLLKEGMVIAIEAIYNIGQPELILDNDGWTLRTKDKALSGLFERTVAITKNGPLVLTK